MTKILVIGAGGVGSVAVHKMAMLSDIFTDITLASRRLFKCDEIAASVLARTGVFLFIHDLTRAPPVPTQATLRTTVVCI